MWHSRFRAARDAILLAAQYNKDTSCVETKNIICICSLNSNLYGLLEKKRSECTKEVPNSIKTWLYPGTSTLPLCSSVFMFALVFLFQISPTPRLHSHSCVSDCSLLSSRIFLLVFSVTVSILSIFTHLHPAAEEASPQQDEAKARAAQQGRWVCAFVK